MVSVGMWEGQTKIQEEEYPAGGRGMLVTVKEGARGDARVLAGGGDEEDVTVTKQPLMTEGRG